jgi:hypothetical protein
MVHAFTDIISKAKTNWRNNLLFSKENIAILLAILILNVFLLSAYLPLPAVLAYIIGFGVLIFLYLRYELSKAHFKHIFIAVTIAFIVVYTFIILAVAPSFTERMDRDELLTASSQLILSGESPYKARWVVGDLVAFNRVNVLPFTLIYAIPFYLLGNVALQNIVAYAFLAFIIFRIYRKNENLAMLSLILLSVSPILFFEFMGLSDLLTGLALVVGALYYLTQKRLVTSAVFIALAAITRHVVWLVGGVYVAHLLKNNRIKNILLVCALVAGIVVILSLPFALNDPDGFMNVFSRNQEQFEVLNPYFRDIFPMNDVKLVLVPVVVLFSLIAGYFARNFNKLCLIAGTALLFFFGTLLVIRMGMDYSHLTWVATPFYLAFSADKGQKSRKRKKKGRR